MSKQLPNDGMHFKTTGGLVRSIALYPDDYQNQWRIELVGDERAVWSIIEQPRIVLNAIPEDHEDFFERHDNAQHWAEELPFEDEPLEEQEEIDELPELQVTVSLMQVASPEALHVVDIVFDPFIAVGKRHSWIFRFGGRVSNFRIGVTKIEGDVSWSSWTTYNGTVGRADVLHVEGNPAEYEISSHVGARIDQE